MNKINEYFSGELGLVRKKLAAGAAGFAVIEVIAGILFVNYYSKNIAFECPECQSKFNANRTEILCAPHTASKRKLTCPVCGKTNYCRETVL